MKFSERRPAHVTIDLLLSAINVAGDAVIVYEIDENGALRFAYGNMAFYEMTGYDPAEAIGKPLDTFRLGMPDDPGMHDVRDALLSGRSVKTEVCSYRKDGTSFWNQVTLQPIRNSEGVITHWISVERDVTEAVERHSVLEDQNARLVALGDAARDLFGALDMPTLTARFQAAVRELTGADAEIVPSGSRAATEATPGRISVRAGDAYVAHIQSARRLRDGDRLVIELLAQYFAVAARNAALVGEIEQQRNAVLELNQIKTDLIAMLAHDFKGPLTNILGYADLTAEMGDVNEDQQEYLEAIRRSALRLADLATDTLALSRLERNEIELAEEHVNVAQLLREVAESSSRRAIELDLDEDATIVGDARRLRQVFYNLIENAIKYSPSGAPVIVRLRKGSEHVRIEVADRGIGIPPADLERIFDRFARAGNARRLRIPGTGFGLFLAQQIVQMHGGAIAVESVEGEGSTFTVTLPVEREARELQRPLRVAVIEGSSEARSFITHALREAGLRTRFVPSIAALDPTMLEADRIVVDCDAVAFDGDTREQLEQASRACGASLVAVGSNIPEFSSGVAVLRKPYLMRDLVALVQDRRRRAAE